MTSAALQTWLTLSRRALDQIEAAHAAVGGTGPGRRYTTQQINQAYAVLLSSQFQRFCRDLHAEVADLLVGPVTLPGLRAILREQLTVGRKLDAGNPNPSNLGADFGRLGLNLWRAVAARQPRAAVLRARLEELNRWRNAIAHQDFDPARLGGRTELRLSVVRRWRAACAGLARAFDAVAADHVVAIIGLRPW